MESCDYFKGEITRSGLESELLGVVRRGTLSVECNFHGVQSIANASLANHAQTQSLTLSCGCTFCGEGKLSFDGSRMLWIRLSKNSRRRARARGPRNKFIE